MVSGTPRLIAHRAIQFSMTLVQEIRELSAEIKRERSVPSRLQEFYNACVRMVPLADQAASIIEKNQGRAK
jgi:hypothetical protein